MSDIIAEIPPYVREMLSGGILFALGCMSLYAVGAVWRAAFAALDAERRRLGPRIKARDSNEREI